MVNQVYAFHGGPLMKSFTLLIAAIISEVMGTTCLKFSNGFTEIIPTAGALLLYVTSFYLLSLTLREFEIGVTYAIWSGVGCALVALVGIIAFNENFTSAKVLSLLMIIIGVMGLNVSGNIH